MDAYIGRCVTTTTFLQITFCSQEKERFRYELGKQATLPACSPDRLLLGRYLIATFVECFDRKEAVACS